MKIVTTKSGIKGWQAKLQEIYENFDEFQMFSDVYGVAARLGYASAEIAWDANPVIQGSVNPSDLSVVNA